MVIDFERTRRVGLRAERLRNDLSPFTGRTGLEGERGAMRCGLSGGRVLLVKTVAECGVSGKCTKTDA